MAEGYELTTARPYYHIWPKSGFQLISSNHCGEFPKGSPFVLTKGRPSHGFRLCVLPRLHTLFSLRPAK